MSCVGPVGEERTENAVFTEMLAGVPLDDQQIPTLIPMSRGEERV